MSDISDERLIVTAVKDDDSDALEELKGIFMYTLIRTNMKMP